jgi:hypothetical protein
MLPGDVLEQINTVLPEVAARMYPKSRELEAWAQAQPSRVIQTHMADDAVIAEALRELPVPADERVIVSWRESDAVLMPWLVFAQHWAAFCYPSSDDVAVWPAGEGWVLAYHHAEFFCWRERQG